MSAWEEAATDAVRAVLWQKREFVTAPDIMEALAPHIATRDAATWAQACEAMQKHMTRSAQDVRLHAGEMTAQEMRTVQAVLRWLRETLPPQPQSGGTK